MKKGEKKSTVTYLSFLMKILKAIRRQIKKVDRIMEGKYSPALLARTVTVIAAVVVSVILFLPNYLGVANDGSTDEIMKSAGLYYMEQDPESIYANYFIRTYTEIPTGFEQKKEELNGSLIFIKFAKMLDDFVTRDRMFDIRFLGFVYYLCYLPAFYFFIRQACQRVKQFSEGAMIAGAGLILFSDVGYVTYFNSFYPEALWFIAMLSCIGACMSFQNDRSYKWDFIALLVILLSVSLIVSSKRQCAVIGFLFAIYLLRLIFVRKNLFWGVSCVLAAFLLSVFSFVSVLNRPSDFSETSKFHAMTRGVLFSSSDPFKTLFEFGIDSSYELLADASAYDYLPFVPSKEPSLYQGFLDQYTISDIGIYYLRHPGSLLSMIDSSIKVGMDMRRSNCGNYEKEAGFPEKAKSLFWSGWSSFKELSAPKTLGYVVILTGAVIVLFYKGYSIFLAAEKRNTIFLDMLLMIFVLLLSQSIVVIVNSGDAEMVQRLFLVGMSIDIMTYCVFAELLHKMRIV